MADFSQAVFAKSLCFVSDTVIIQIQLVAAITARVDAEGDGVHLAVRVQFTNVLLQLSLRDDGTFSNVNGAVVPTRVVPRSVKIELDPSLDRFLQWFFVICVPVPLASRGKVHCTVCLT